MDDWSDLLFGLAAGVHLVNYTSHSGCSFGLVPLLLSFLSIVVDVVFNKVFVVFIRQECVA